MWHQDPAVKSEMLSAFSAVYLTDGAGEHAEALAPEEIAHNLMHLVRHCDVSEVWLLNILYPCEACFCFFFPFFNFAIMNILLDDFYGTNCGRNVLHAPSG